MIMRRGRQQLLLPASPAFIAASLLVSFALDMALNMGLSASAAWRPDFVALVLVFWSVHQPQRVGMGIAFVFGLFIDVHLGAALGVHSLAYSVLSFLAIAVRRRLLWFGIPGQALQVLPLFALAHLIELALRMLAGGAFPGFTVLAAPALEALLWLPVSTVLLAPQRRTPEPDENRPL